MFLSPEYCNALFADPLVVSRAARLEVVSELEAWLGVHLPWLCGSDAGLPPQLDPRVERCSRELLFEPALSEDIGELAEECGAGWASALRRKVTGLVPDRSDRAFFFARRPRAPGTTTHPAVLPAIEVLLSAASWPPRFLARSELAVHLATYALVARETSAASPALLEDFLAASHGIDVAARLGPARGRRRSGAAGPG